MLGMCNAISPERAVIWTVLFEGRADPRLRAEHFTHDTYARWFAKARDLMGAGQAFSEQAFAAETQESERRALKRMLRVPPPPRVRSNAALLVDALADRHAGRRVHIERLIN